MILETYVNVIIVPECLSIQNLFHEVTKLWSQWKTKWLRRRLIVILTYCAGNMATMHKFVDWPLPKEHKINLCLRKQFFTADSYRAMEIMACSNCRWKAANRSKDWGIRREVVIFPTVCHHASCQDRNTSSVNANLGFLRSGNFCTILKSLWNWMFCGHQWPSICRKFCGNVSLLPEMQLRRVSSRVHVSTRTRAHTYAHTNTNTHMHTHTHTSE